MKTRIITLIKIIFLILVAWFVVKFFITDAEELKSLEFRFDLLKFVLAVIFFVIYKVMQCLLWHYITVKNKSNIPIEKAIISWFYSLLGKYIPGKVLLLGGRLYFYQKEGVSKKKTTFCFFIENVCTLLGAAFLLLFSMLFSEVNIFEEYRYAVIILIIFFFVIIHPKIFEVLINTPLKLFKKKEIKIEITYKDMFQFVILFVLNWFIVGIGFYILVTSVYPVGIENIFYVSGAFGLAVIIGLLSLFAPSGIGVREGVMILVLQYIMPETVAVVVSLLSRIWATLSELFLVAVIFLYAQIRERIKINKGGLHSEANCSDSLFK